MVASVVLIAGFLVLVGYLGFCLYQVVEARDVRFLPRWVWGFACIFFIPLGGIAFLTVGRVWGARRSV
jgi:hypothetical protein